MKKDKIKNWIKFILIIGGIPLVTLWIVLDNKSIISAIKSNPAYAIGIVTHCSKSTHTFSVKGAGSNSSGGVNVRFFIEKKRIETDSKGMGPKDSQNVNEGNQYVVIYDSSNPEKCVVLFDYPVKDSLDFTLAVEKLKINPPNIDR